FFFFTDPPPTAIYPLSLHDALPIFSAKAWITSTPCGKSFKPSPTASPTFRHSCLNVHVDFPLLQRIALPITIGSVRYPGIKIHRSEEHTSELQSRFDLVCRLLLEKK